MKIIKKLNVYFIFGLFSAIILLPQINQHSLVLGADSLFHFNRFYDTMMQIKTGNFQYFVSMYGFSQSGRIVNALYGPYVAYLNGFIMLLTGSWFKYQLVSSWLLNVIACCSMYYLLRVNNVKKSYSTWISILFITTFVITTWTTGQRFTAWGVAMMPLGIAAGTRMIRDKDNPVSIIELTLGVTILFQTHVLSTLFLLLILFYFFIWSLFTVRDRIKLIKNIVISAIFTIFLTSNVWGSFLEVYGSNVLLAPFQNIKPFEYGAISLSINSSWLSFGIIILLLFQIMFVFSKPNNSSSLNKGVTVGGLMLLISSTRLLPWNQIFSHFPIIDIIQFPYRLLGPAVILLFMGLGLSLTQLDQEIKGKNGNYTITILGVLTILSALSALNNIDTQATIWHTNKVVAEHKNVKQLAHGDKLRQAFNMKISDNKPLKQVYKPTPDYLPLLGRHIIPEHPYYEYDKYIIRNSGGIYKSVVNNKLEISWNSPQEKIKKINVVKYKHTVLTLNGRMLTSKDYKLSKIGAVSIKSRKGYNNLTLKYKATNLFSLLLVLNGVAWFIFLIVIVGCIFINKNRKHTRTFSN
ncbi:hypothetical protein [Leuconostoc carnosum]|uniref:hypothetical protein n=1 Tax=Leuconostoc carnosum TaxID=1252 RepID=UPI00345D8974